MINLEGIKNIIFDLGNVIVDIDFELTVQAFQKLGGDKIDLNLENYMDHPIFGAIEKGEITPAQFRDEIRRMLQKEVSDEQIDQAWGAVIINTDQARIDLIKKLSTDYRLFILSNTDAIHIARATAIFKNNFNIDMEALFEKCYYSHDLAMEKPGLEIYKTVLNDAGMLAKETVFIDDKEDNVEAALSLDIQAYHLDTEKDSLCSLFSR